MVYNINDKSIIYVVCPAKKKTGGTELAHQLVNELNHLGLKSFITYYNTENTVTPINEAFYEYVKEYKVIEDIIDSEENVLIVPEICFRILNNYSTIQKSIWWMSVDNYVKNDGFIGACQVDGIYKSIRGVISGRLTLRKKGFDKNIVHLYQSEYANEYLKKQGVKRRFRLSDYVNDSYLYKDGTFCSKDDIVLYNPKKGMEYTKRIMEASQGLMWKPIVNMTSAQVKELLNKSKLYIDFGNHPGKDRFPREAAICDCCVITGKRGSAAYFEDVPIPDEFKFDENEDIENIVKKIKSCLDNYDEEIKKFQTYREYISNEHIIFKDDIRRLFVE